MNTKEFGFHTNTTGSSSADHEFYLRKCFKLARLGEGLVSPNPMVGAVLVHGSRVIGQGYHTAYGHAHAEVHAIDSVQESDRPLIPTSRLYVSLEPCNHFGKTPPCTELILRSGIQQVIIACYDPNPLMAGKSISHLKASGVHVEGPILESDGLDLIRAFRTNILCQRPYVLLKLAQTADFYMGKAHERTKISNPVSDLLVHKWRSETDALVIGKETLLTDNPELTTRLWPGKNPRRIVLGKVDALSRSQLKFFNTTEEVLTLEDFAKSDYIEPEDFLKQLWENHQIGSIIIEGGPKTIQSFYERGLWDEARVITNKTMILREGLKSPSIKGWLEKKMILENDEICYIRKTNPNTLNLI